MTALRKMNTNQLRDLAVSMGANRKRLYGTSKDSLILRIQKMSDIQEAIRFYKKGIALLEGREEEAQKTLKEAYKEELARLEEGLAKYTA